MKVGVVKETHLGERRVALAPGDLPRLAKLGLQTVIEAGAGLAAGYTDQEYLDKGGQISQSRREALAADIIAQVRSLGANQDLGGADLATFRPGQIVIGSSDPLGAPQAIQQLAETGVSHFALELMPRITRAQSMDVLSAMATIAGYRAVLLAAIELPKLFPMLTTAAGTLTASRVFVIGAGVAGLQAIATAKRLGAIVHAYDLRPACREQVESVGGRFVELQLDANQAEDKGGYARQMDESFYQRQRELLGDVVAENDVVITTAAIPGKRSPLLVTADALDRMKTGSVVVDMAAERGGNCERTLPDQRVVHNGVTILGPTNLPAEAPYHASQMYSRNVTNFLANLIKNGSVQWNMQDEILSDTLVCHEGQIPHPRIRQLLGLPEAQPAASSDT